MMEGYDYVPLSPEYHAQLPNEAVLFLGATALLSMGVYDASQDRYEVTEHPEDDQWTPRSNN